MARKSSSGETPAGDSGTSRGASIAPEFLDRLAHDLRGPLSPLQTAAYLLRRDDLGADRRRELLDIIDRQTVRLGGMVQEVSDWMRAQQGRLAGRREPFSVPMLVELGCAELAAAGGNVDLPESLDEAMVHGDSRQLVHMLATLVSYAQSSSGVVGVDVAARRSGDRVRVTIAQRGTPLSEPLLAALFQAPQPAPFDEGLGMRLLIAQAIAQEHGGTVTARAESEMATEIRIELPLLDPAD